MLRHDVFRSPPLPPVSENLMDCRGSSYALRRASAGRITAVSPTNGYARKERKDAQPGEPIRQVWPTHHPGGCRQGLLMDLIPSHRGFSTSHRPLTAHKILAPTSEQRLVPLRGGRPRRRRRQAGREHGQAARGALVFGYKRRTSDDAAEVLEVAGEGRGRDWWLSRHDHHAALRRPGKTLKTPAPPAGHLRLRPTPSPLTDGAVERPLRARTFGTSGIRHQLHPGSAGRQDAGTVLSVAPLAGEADRARAREPQRERTLSANGGE